jgi:hypothetical protein
MINLATHVYNSHYPYKYQSSSQRSNLSIINIFSMAYSSYFNYPYRIVYEV